MERSRTKELIARLNKAYPDAHCELHYDNPFHLLVAVILSAQCTDKRVNQVTEKLFQVFDTPQDFAGCDITQLEKLIYSCGFYRNKAKNIKNAATEILTKFGGKVPDTFDELLSLAGVGRKTANVMMSVAFGGNNIAVDTHVFRVSHRLGLSQGKTPYDVERDLTRQLDPEDYSSTHHLLIFHGRYCCKAQRPDCGVCPVREFCTYLPLIEEENQNS